MAAVVIEDLLTAELPRRFNQRMNTLDISFAAVLTYNLVVQHFFTLKHLSLQFSHAGVFLKDTTVLIPFENKDPNRASLRHISSTIQSRG